MRAPLLRTASCVRNHAWLAGARPEGLEAVPCRLCTCERRRQVCLIIHFHSIVFAGHTARAAAAAASTVYIYAFAAVVHVGRVARAGRYRTGPCAWRQRPLCVCRNARRLQLHNVIHCTVAGRRCRSRTDSLHASRAVARGARQHARARAAKRARTKKGSGSKRTQ